MHKTNVSFQTRCSEVPALASRLGWVVAVAVLAIGPWGGAAQAQAPNKDQERCINGVNKAACKVAATQGKENRGCVKLASKGTASAGCLTADPKSKVFKAIGKVTKAETKFCGSNPAFGYTTGATAVAASQNAELGLFTDVFGTTDPTTVISTDKTIGRCQAAVAKAVEKVAATKWKEFVRCKKAQLKSGAVTDITGIEACVTPLGIAADEKGKIVKAVQKLGNAIVKKCVGVAVATAFPGACSTSLGGISTRECLDERIECRVCEALNASDGMNVDCDLFDDGLNNGSCGVGLLDHTCTLANTSSLDLNIAGSFGNIVLGFPLAGSVTLSAGGSAATCTLDSITPLDVPGLGTLCISPGSSTCTQGARQCAGGPALGIDVATDANIGSCTTKAACDSACSSLCSGSGTSVLTTESGCTGHCTGAVEQSCVDDSGCAGNGRCRGYNGFALSATGADVCQCSCVDRAAHGASGAGETQCEASANIVVETAQPCDGTDVLLNVGDSCLPLTTQRATNLIVNANAGFAGGVVPQPPDVNDQSGLALACAAVDAGNVSGMSMVGAFGFLNTALGDISVALRADCQ